eukprot:3574933-Karenia_brevis.AAC.1
MSYLVHTRISAVSQSELQTIVIKTELCWKQPPYFAWHLWFSRSRQWRTLRSRGWAEFSD